jgi:hypothetical protein
MVVVQVPDQRYPQKKTTFIIAKLIIHNGLSSIQNNGFYYSGSLCDHHFIHKINLCWWASTCYQWSCCSTPIHYYYHYDTINMDLGNKINVVWWVQIPNISLFPAKT